MSELVTLDTRENGDLAVVLTDAGRAEIEDARAGDVPDDATLWLLLEWHLCNGWGLFDADEIGALSQAPVLADGWDANARGEIEVVDGKWWYFEPYQVRSVVMELRRAGVAIFTKGA